MHVNLWLRGFSFYEFVVSILFGHFVQHDWGVSIYLNYAFKLWVEAYTLSPGYEESVGLYLSLTTSSRLCEVYSSIQAFSAFVIIYLVVYPLPIYFLNICYLVRMIALLGIWLATCFGKDATLEVTYLWCSASRIRCIMTIIHVSYYEFYDLCFVSFSTWGCVICNVSFKLDALYSLFEIYV